MRSYRIFLIAGLLIVVSSSFSTALAINNPPQESERSRKRDAWQRPAEVIDALGVKTGHRVADIGSGFGYFTFRLAARVGAEGKVFAVDIDKEAIDKVRQRKQREKLEHARSAARGQFQDVPLTRISPSGTALYPLRFFGCATM